MTRFRKPPEMVATLLSAVLHWLTMRVYWRIIDTGLFRPKLTLVEPPADEDRP